ncbi:MAG: B12-binding domain-containing radical SAM protein [Saprospiraceae bacterium]|nr:B12-binding domain-containing radical SAM protein [Saprospiraceae bacterium]
MADLLITNAYFYRFDAKQWSIAQPYPPLGTITVASYMRSLGHQITFYDNCLSAEAAEIQPKIQAVRPDFFIIYDDGFNYLTKMCLTVMREAAFDMLQFAKSLGCKTVISSSDSTDHFEMYHEQGADFVLHGEGEHTLKELVEAAGQGENYTDVKGLSYKDAEGEIHKNLKRPVLRDLDTLPMAAWDLIDVEEYRKIWMAKGGNFSLNIATTRGCPFKCNWCAKPIYGNRYNSRSPEHVLEEIQYLVEHFGVDYFWMCDDIFGLKPGWVQRFRDLRNERGLKFRYKIQSRVDLMLQDDNLAALVDSGADTIWVGAESGSQKILDAMDKGTQVEQIYEATRLLKKHGIKVAFFLQFGYPGETIVDIRKTIGMVLDLLPDDIGISISYPLPGTKFYEKVKSQLVLKANWKDSDDLDLMFANTYSPKFYKTLHRYVHHRYRIKKGWQAINQLLSRPKGKAYEVASILYHLPMACMRHILLLHYANK